MKYHMRRSLIILAQFILAFIFWLTNYFYANNQAWRLFLTFLALGIIYVAFRVVIQHLITRNMTDERTRYTARRMLSVLYVIAFAGSLVLIWIDNTQSIVVSFGIVGAGLAIALQDMFRNIAGGIVILLTGMFKVGDRIEVGNKTGDVIDIGIMYTTVLELNEWVDANQPTGRLSNIPNSAAIDSVVNNFSRDFSFVWAELELPITYDSDWRTARGIVLQVLKEVVGATTARAEKEISDMTHVYYLKTVSVEPAVYITLTDNWVSLHIRYPVPINEARLVKDLIFTKILDEFEKRNNITIASSTQTITITNFREGPMRADRG